MKTSATLLCLPSIFSLLLFIYFSLSTVCGDLIFFSLSPSVSYAETKALPADPKLDQGRELLKSGQYQEALSLLSEAAAMEPANPVVQNYLGEAYFRLKKYQEAADALNRAISLDPGYLLPHVGLGIVYETIGETEKAKTEFAEALRIGSTSPDASEVKFAADRLKRIEVREHLSKGRTLYGAGKSEEALAEYNLAIAKDADNPQANMAAGLIYKELNRLKESYEAFKKVIEVQPGNVRAHLNMGELHGTAGALEAAIASFREVIRLAPGSREAGMAEFFIKSSEEGLAVRKLFEDASVLMKNERYDDAVDTYRKILEKQPENSYALYNMGVAYYKTERLEEALTVLKKSIEINPQDIMTRFQLAAVYDKMTKIEEAVAEYERVAASESDREEVKNARDRLDILKKYAEVKEGAGRIQLLIEGGDVEEALKEVEKLLVEDDRNANAHLLLGRVQMKKGDTDKAFSSIKKALSIKPDLWDAFIFMGQIYELQGKYSEAADVYRAVTSKTPKTKEGLIAADLLESISIPMHFEQAKRYLDKGDTDGALKEINTILEISPDNPVALFNAGILYFRANMLADAQFYLKKAIEKDPGYVQAHLQLGLVYQAALKFEEAEAQFKKVISLNPEGRDANIAKLRLGIIKEEAAFLNLMIGVYRLINAKNYVRATEELETIITLIPNNHLARFQLAIILEDMDRREDAIIELKKVLEIKPDYTRGHLFLGQLYEKDGLFREAKESYRNASVLGAGTREGEIAAMLVRKHRNWQLNGNIGHSIDSNIAYGATKRKTGISTGHSLSINYGVYTVEKMRFTVDLSVSRNLTYSSQLFGMNYEGGLKWYHKIRDDQSYGINADYVYSTFLYKRSYEAFTYSVNTSVNPDIFLSSLSLRYSFNMTRSFINPTSDSDKHTLSLSFSKKLSLKDSVSGSYSFSVYLNKDPMGSNYANRANGFSLSYSRTLRPGLSIGANYGWSFIDYSNPDSTTFFTQFRRNRSETFGVNMSYRLSDKVSFSISASSANVNTNLPPPSAEERLKLQDILAAPIPTVGGGYEKETVSMGLSVSY